MEPIGLYIHVPFCTQKCPYCDFYSLTHTKQMKDYTDCIINRLYTYRNVVGRNADTLYFGGGTPSTLGANRLCSIIDEAKNCFGLEQAEITVEVNPSGQLEFARCTCTKRSQSHINWNAVRTCGRAGFIGQNTHSKSG